MRKKQINLTNLDLTTRQNFIQKEYYQRFILSVVHNK